MKPDEKMYLAYFESKKLELYFNELKELTGLADSSLANTLKQLVAKRILSVNKTKSNTYYLIKNKKLFALKFSEIALKNFSELNRGVRLPLQSFLKQTPRTVFSIVLFGSATRKKERKDSDIDLLIVSDLEFDVESLKKEVESVSNYPLNIFRCNVEQFVKAEDHIIIQARKTGFPIMGEQNFYEVQLR
jgi:predicted nucleotidyltransferase